MRVDRAEVEAVVGRIRRGSETLKTGVVTVGERRTGRDGMELWKFKEIESPGD